jgi:magnesium-transporting ATPase (P-type)
MYVHGAQKQQLYRFNIQKIARNIQDKIMCIKLNKNKTINIFNHSRSMLYRVSQMCQYRFIGTVITLQVITAIFTATGRKQQLKDKKIFQIVCKTFLVRTELVLNTDF